MNANDDVAIVGYGAVGRALESLFPGAQIYDEPRGIGSRDAVNACRYAFVCVPTPTQQNGRCDLSCVEDVVGWLGSEYIIIRSTIEVGTTTRLRRETGKRIVFNPAYGPGQPPNHPFHAMQDTPWIILGGPRADTVPIADLYKRCFNADIVIQQAAAETAELCKYMENAFLATKVAFCNEFYDFAGLYGVDYNELRELWLLDPRIGRSHTFVLPDARGFGGDCLPKDLAALVTATRQKSGQIPLLLQAVIESNTRVRAAGSGDDQRD